jgi:hypothetical protein
MPAAARPEEHLEYKEKYKKGIAFGQSGEEPDQKEVGDISEATSSACFGYKKGLAWGPT